jgi:hypothetical protein
VRVALAEEHNPLLMLMAVRLVVVVVVALVVVVVVVDAVEMATVTAMVRVV